MLLGVLLPERAKQVPYGKQRGTKNSTPEIQIMTKAMLVEALTLFTE